MSQPNDLKPEIVDLTSCDREPIHIPGRVQSFGALISVTRDWIINHISSNVGTFLGLGEHEFFGTPLKDWIDGEAIHIMRSRLQLLGHADAVERIFDLTVTPNGPPMDVAVHVSGNSILMEFERHQSGRANDFIGYIRPMMERINKSKTIEALCQTATRQLKALVGFDRVMCYRFDESGSGQVIAETLTAEVESYMGLRYPASDIPKQARAMYQRNLLRIISDVDDEGAVITPTLSPAGEPLDMTMSTTRAVSPIHLEYLRNMGVKASMSISILVRGELWGLFACHHYEPRILSYEVRSATELFAQLFAFSLSEMQNDQRQLHQTRARMLHDQIMAQLADGQSLSDNLDIFTKAIGSLIDHSGIVSWVDGGFKSQGLTPSRKQFLGLAKFLNTSAANQIFSTNSIRGIYPQGEDFVSTASGMLAIPLSRHPRDYLVLFRQELKQTVDWAGDPNKPVAAGPNGARLSPRKSFEAWQEIVDAHSAPWKEEEKLAAEGLRVTLLEVVLRMTDASIAERDRSQQKQELLIAELNHRVRNILNLIRGLISQSSHVTDISDFTEIVGGRIHALARAHDQITKENWSPASLIDLIETEGQAYLGGKSGRVNISGPNVLIAPTAFTTLSLVIHELMTNSMKYGALSDQRGAVKISLSYDGDEGLSILWEESDGPKVNAPTRKGFGTTIIERSIPFELKGSAKVTYAPKGLIGEFTVPPSFIAGIAERSEAPDENATMSTEQKSLSGRVLIVEDNMIIALDAEDMLRELGAEDIIVVSDVASALAATEGEPISFALLDVNLGSETSEVVARKLIELKTPFAFATGYGDDKTLAGNFPDTPIIQKPYGIDSVKNALGKLF